MALTRQTAAVRARGLLTQKSEAECYALAEIQLAIPSALQDWGRLIAMNPKKRDRIRTPYSTTTVAVVNGVADIGSLVTSARLMLDQLSHARMNLENAPSRVSIQLVQTLDQLATESILDSFYIRALLEGTSLIIKDPANTDVATQLTSLNDTLHIDGSKYPLITEVPVDLEGEFVQFVADFIPRYMKDKHS